MNLTGFDWMGTILRRRHQSDYRNVGFSFSTGNFIAVKQSNGSYLGPQEQSIPEASCRTSNQLLAQVDADQFYLLFHEMNGVSRQYFIDEQPFYQLGSVFNIDDLPQLYTHPRRLARLFDVLIHFDETKAAVLR